MGLGIIPIKQMLEIMRDGKLFVDHVHLPPE
jgi:hypothetical protein